MLRGLTWKQFLEWQYFAELEPFGEERDDYRTALIAKTLWDIARDQKKHPQPFPIADFVLRWGDAATPARKQTWQEQKLVAKMIVAQYNAKAKKTP